MNFAGRALVTLAVQIVAYLAGLVASVLVARALLDTAFGTFRVAQLALSYASHALYLGVEHGVAHFGARDEDVRRVAKTALVYALAGGFAMAALVFAGSLMPAVRSALGADVPWFQLALLTIPATVTGALARALALTRRRFAFYNALVSTDRTAFAMLAVIAFVAGLLNLASALLAYTIAVLILGFTAGFYLARIAKGTRSDRPMLFAMLRYGSRLYAGQWVLPSLFALGLVAVSFVSGAAAAGQFSVALVLAQTLLFVPNAVAAVLTPEASRQRERDSRGLVGTVLRLNLYLLVLLAVVLEATAAAVTLLLYGEHYRGAIVLLAALIPGAVAYGAASPAWAFYASSGNPGVNTRAALVALVAQLALLAVGLPSLGPLGGAVATSVAYAIVFVLLLVEFTRDRGFVATLRPTAADRALVLTSLRRMRSSSSEAAGR